jgi:hypothetical protein
MAATSSRLQQPRRRRDRRNLNVTSVVRAMRRGAVMLRIHSPTGVEWALSSGERLSEQFAEVLVRHPNVTAGDDMLPLPGIGKNASQSFHFTA